jgi:hypothetical protein
MIIFLSVLVALIGLVLYLAASNPKVVELGRIAFFCGLLAFLFTVSGSDVIRIGR